MKRHIVYVVFDVLDDGCVYVGQTGDYSARMQAHKSKSPWTLRTTIRVETFEAPTREQALWLESILISLLDPRENKRGKDEGRRAFRSNLLMKALGDPRSAIYCDCEVSDPDAIGECRICRRKPAELLRRPA